MASELATVNGRLLAIGSVQINDYSEVVAWESSDGATWTEVDTGDFRTDGDLAVDLTTGPGGLVAITHQYVSGSGSAWRSADGGRTWTEHRPPGTDVAVLAAVGTTRGYLLAGAVNETYENPPTSSPRIWYSPDGQGTSWEEATLEGSADAGLVEQLTIDGSGRWVAIGMLNQRTTVWRSTDRGLSWQVTADLGAVDSSRTEFRLAGAPDGFIAISRTDPAVTWTSPDGAAWSDGGSARPTGVADDASIAWARGIARIGDVIVVAGLPTPPSGPQGPWFSWIGQLTR